MSCPPSSDACLACPDLVGSVLGFGHRVKHECSKVTNLTLVIYLSPKYFVAVLAVTLFDPDIDIPNPFFKVSMLSSLLDVILLENGNKVVIGLHKTYGKCIYTPRKKCGFVSSVCF